MQAQNLYFCASRIYILRKQKYSPDLQHRSQNSHYLQTVHHIHAHIMYCLINLHGAKVNHCPIIVPQRTINVNTNTQLGCLSQMIKNITSDNVINVVKMTTTYLGKCARQILPVRKEDIPENKAYTIVMYPTI